MTETSPRIDALQPAGAPSARRLGVLGLGRAGLAYATAIAGLDGFTLAGLVDDRGARRTFARSAGFAAPSAPTLEKLRARAELDALVVAVPAWHRVATLEAALATGLPVLVDGLPAHHIEGADRLAPALERAGAPVGCVIGTRFHPLFARAARVLAARAIGRTFEVRASVYVSRVFASDAPPERGDVLDFAVAEMVVLLDALFGPPREVNATAHRLYGARMDEVHAQLTLDGGVVAGLDGSWSVPGYPRASLVVEVSGSEGTLLVSDDALEVELPLPFEDLPSGHTRHVLAEEPDDVAFEGGDAARAIAAFATALDGGPLPATLDPRPALRAAAALDALRRSIADDGRPQEVRR